MGLAAFEISAAGTESEANSFALKSDCLEIRFFRSMLSFITAVVCWSHVTCLPDYMGV